MTNLYRLPLLFVSLIWLVACSTVGTGEISQSDSMPRNAIWFTDDNSMMLEIAEEKTIITPLSDGI